MKNPLIDEGICQKQYQASRDEPCFIAFEPWKQLERHRFKGVTELKLSWNKSVLLQSAGGLLGDSSVIKRLDSQYSISGIME